MTDFFEKSLSCQDIVKRYELSYNAVIRTFNLKWDAINSSNVDEKTTNTLKLKNQYSLDYNFNENILRFSSYLDYKIDFLSSVSLGLITRHTIANSIALSLEINNEERDIGVFDFSFRLDAILGKRNFIFPSSSIEFLFNFDKDSISGFKTSLANSFRSPTMNELYYNTKYKIANPNLSAEKSLSYDLSFFVKAYKGIEMGAGFFFRREFSSIIWEDNTSKNLRNLGFYGTELYFDSFFIFGKASEILFYFEYTFAIAYYLKDWTKFDLNHNHIFKSIITYSYTPYFSFNFSVDYYSGFRDIEGFFDLALSLLFFYKGVSFNFAILNLAGQKLRYHNYTSIVPRSYTISISIKDLGIKRK